MAKLGQSSFRRILLSRLLLLSVPVLLTGVYVTYRKARSTLLETARQNLTESAVRKAESIQESITALKANLVTASETVVLQSRSRQSYQTYLNQLAQQLPTQIQCVQLTNLQTRTLEASTCGNQPLNTTVPVNFWSQRQNPRILDRSKVYVSALSMPPSTQAASQKRQASSRKQLELVFSAPVYDADGQLQYALTIQSALLQQEQTRPGSLAGYPVVFNQDGLVLAHPIAERVGSNITQDSDAQRLATVRKNAIANNSSFLHLFSLEKDGEEYLAGYTSLSSPITSEPNQRWIILAVTRLDSALAGLGDIQQVLLILTCGLLATCLLATIYIARTLARPLEKLRDYALSEQERHFTHRVPHNFQIREFNQLSEAMEGMILRLKDWAEELETAWKEAQAANQLKNEFLATTSHELRTPLNGIIGCIRLVRDGFCDDREEELDFLKRADDAAIHLLGIINDVLDIAKIESGKLSVELEPIDLQCLIDEVINLQAVHVQQKGLTLHTSKLDDVIAVNADPAKLKQVLINVVGNAVKFTDRGSITIKMRLESNQNGQTTPELQDAAIDNQLSLTNGKYPTVAIAIKDTGIGIDPMQQQKLFRPFVMVDGSTTRKFGGTGLGLAISRNLIELMGGTISLGSKGEGHGTTVEIVLPTIEPSLLPFKDCPEATQVTQKKAATDNNGADKNGAVIYPAQSAAGEL
ncbi:MAG: two-component sensor histidine kinase [Kastovskya adunca ATA6-11-RM4]|jgi:signal transduction histidine kinase|nr:two-component sensor histidine kinase [Kastovskya adunca ATA6-11-RM4]